MFTPASVDARGVDFLLLFDSHTATPPELRYFYCIIFINTHLFAIFA